ncbi:hypothetical protein CRUP_015576 [Coryphaenoides rupestris]|nr:hypothetical protein CRUP_015576 [Coryphaenoides rupestris]
MLGNNHGIQPVTVVFNNAKNCFIHLPASVISHLSLHEALELSWAHDGSPVFLSWTRSSRSSSKPEDLRVELCRQLGEKLGLRDGEQELHSASLEQQLLDQIRVVFKGAVFPVWVDHRTAVYVRIATLEPAVPHGRLEQFTELVVSPKTRLGTDSLLRSPPGTSQKKSPPPYSHSTSDPALLPRPPSPPRPPGKGAMTGHPPDRHRPSHGAATAAVAAVVCHQPPNALCTINPGAAAVVHLFPWSETIDCSSGLTRSAVTYGLLSKVPSPQEARDGAKSAEVKKKKKKRAQVHRRLDRSAEGARGGGRRREEGKEKEVRWCAWCATMWEELQDSQNCGEVHAGRVWVMTPSRTAFLDWLHSQSHEPLACLTARQSVILFHGPNAKLELALTVLQPEAQSEPPDQLFLLAPSVLQKAGIQVDRELAAVEAGGGAAGDTTTGKAEVLYTELPYWPLWLSKAGFRFISHSLLGSPLARELGAIGRGLRGGGLLITGTKPGVSGGHQPNGAFAPPLAHREDAVAVEDTLDLAAVAKATDGYLARDLALLLERAVHAGAMIGCPRGWGLTAWAA